VPERAKTYAAPWLALPFTRAPFAPTARMAPDTASERPNVSDEAPSLAVRSCCCDHVEPLREK
jgi:hypothetical protein